MERKISTYALKTGMYVSSLDRPWLDTPFQIQGFYISSADEIAALKHYCDHVYIDPSRSDVSGQFVATEPGYPTNEHLEHFLNGGPRQVDYERTRSTSEEMPVAKFELEKASSRLSSILESVSQSEKLNADDVRVAIEPIIDSIIRNPDAMMWLTQMRAASAYTYTRSVDNCTLAIAFGRHMGLPRKELRNLSMGLLLMDVGMTKVPEPILNKKSRLSIGEFNVIKRHVQHSVDILQNSDGINSDIINIARTHHERFDGSGYPDGLVGTQTPVYGRIAAIIDCYDAMTSKRAYDKARSHHKVLQQIYNWRNQYYQEELVEQFLQFLGVYPTGTLVELNTGEVGIVMSQNPVRRMKPQVMIIMGPDKILHREYTLINLDQQNVLDEEEIFIEHSLDPGSYDIEPSEFYL